MEELKKTLKKQLKTLQTEDRLVILMMGKAQMNGRYAFIRIGINNGQGWIDKTDEIKAEVNEILKANNCVLVGKEDWNNIITY